MITLDQKPWVILTSRYGADTRNPSIIQLQHALTDVYHEDDSSMTESDYAEHPNAWLRCGFDDGPMYVLNVYRSGAVYFAQWADLDYENELEPEAVKVDVSESEALELWELLAAGHIDEIKGRRWNAE